MFALNVSALAAPMDLLKFSCTYQEQQDGQTFLTEIHFKKPNTLNDRASATGNHPVHGVSPNLLEGELLNYSVHGSTKKYISGFSFFSVTYDAGDASITGMSGDPDTHTDGAFSLTKVNSGANQWRFIYTSVTHQQTAATFTCSGGVSAIRN